MRSSFAVCLITACLPCILMPSAASAQSADLTLGVSYSTLYGPTGEIALSAEELGPQQNMNTTLSYRGGPEGEAGRWTLVRAPEVASGRLTYSVSAHVQNWDHIPYESQGARLSVFRNVPLNQDFSIGFGAFGEYDDISGIGSGSGFLARDLGASGRLGAEAQSTFSAGDFGAELPEASRTRLDLIMRLAGLGDDPYGSIEISAQHDFPLVPGFAIATEFTGGIIRGLDDARVSVLHRAFQGEDQPRGFAFGGLGPRDTITGDPLGGTNYYAASAEIQHALSGAPVVIAGFVDFGSTWSLPGYAGPGLEDAHALRASAGLSIEVSSDLGQLRIAYAEPFEHQSYDRLQRVSVALAARF
jgi:outer membrane protein insertion porin family